MAFSFIKMNIPDVVLVISDKFEDKRGFFTEGYKESEFCPRFPRFVQDNISLSCKGTLRGLHYQKNPKPQAKLITCLTGRIFDVAVDIREDSPTFGMYIMVDLSGPGTMLYIPVGFAHGFLALEDNTLISYKCSDYYSPKHDRNIAWNDPQININWEAGGIDIDNNIHVSKKDNNAPLLKDAEL